MELIMHFFSSALVVNLCAKFEVSSDNRLPDVGHVKLSRAPLT